MKRVTGYLTALCLLFVIISQSIVTVTFFMPFFNWQYGRVRNYPPFNGQNAAQTIGASHEDLIFVTIELLDYMRGRRDSLDGIRATVNGVEREFFSDLEKRHMVDVRILYDILFAVRNISFFLGIALILGMVVFRLPILKPILVCSRHVIGGFLIIAGIMTAIISINFDRAWTIFHLIFFDNDYWILTHRVDLLVDMVSLSFFLHICIFLGLLILVKSLAVIILSTVYLKLRKPGYSFARDRL